MQIPEAVSDDYRPVPERVRGAEPGRFLLGTFQPGRGDVQRLCEGTIARISRFRDDIDWELFDEPPSANEIRAVDAWVDPTVDPDDCDGMVAEAQACGVIVIASRTPVNRLRLREGKAGYLVPPNDPNELTHAILDALFRPERAAPMLAAARPSEWYSPERRAAMLLELYERILHEQAR